MNILANVIIILQTIIVSSLDIIPLESNVLPILLGKAYITKRNIQLINHIDLEKIEKLILKYQKEINELKDQKLGFSKTAHYRYLQESNLINVRSLEELLNDKVRIKRGLINVGGKISKILFGTLDSDDEELYKNYFNSIEKNEKVLMRNQKQIATVVNDLKKKYDDKFQKLSESYKLLRIVPALREVEQMHLMMFEIKDIKNILDEIQIAVSFARLHVLHESILPYAKFVELVKNVTIIPVNHLKDYYQICHTKVIFKNKVLLFLISIPTIYEENFNLYKFYYLIQNNLTLPYSEPYMLSQKEELKWSTSQCHSIEGDFLCDQDSLNKPPKCLKNVLKKQMENCPKLTVVPTSNLKLLEDGNILSTNNLEIQEKCPQQTKYHFVPQTAILRSKCVISNNQKEIYPVTTIDEEKYIILPKMDILKKEDSEQENFKKEDFNEVNVPDIHLEEIENWKMKPSEFSLFLILIILIIVVYFIVKYLKKKKDLCKTTPKQGDTFSQDGEELDIIHPVF